MATVCVGDSAYQSAANKAALAVAAKTVAEIALSSESRRWKNKVAAGIADMRQEIMDRQIALAERAQAQAGRFYPAENAYLEAAFAIPKTTPDYAPLSSGWTNFSIEANDAGRQGWLKASRALCMPPDKCDDGRWSSHTRSNEVDTGNFALRQAETRSQALNDVRADRMLKALALGQGKLSSGLGYAQAAGTIARNVGESIAGAVNSAASLLGFFITKDRIKPQWEYGAQPYVDPVNRTSRTGGVSVNQTVDQEQGRFDVAANFMGGGSLSNADYFSVEYANSIAKDIQDQNDYTRSRGDTEARY